MFKHSLTTFPSGLPLIRVPMPGVGSATVLVLSNTGSRYEPKPIEGIAHFFEHMVFKGTKNYPTAPVLAATVDGVGAGFNAFTSREYTGYYVKAASEHLELALDVVSDLLLTPQLRQTDIDREKGVIIEEMNMYTDSPSRHIQILFDQMFFAGSQLAHNIIGNKKTVSSIKRADFLSFLSDWYGLGNMLVILAGDAKVIDRPQTLELVERHFNKKTKKRTLKKVPVKSSLKGNPISADKLKLEYRKTQQAHFVLGWPGIKRQDKDRYALSLLSVILGGNMSSRLFNEVREKRGLCYYVRSDLDVFHDSGVFGASAGVDQSRVEEALKVTVGEFTDLASGEKKITSKELQQAKDYLAGKMVLGFEDSEAVAQYFGMRQLLSDKIETPEELLKKIKTVTLRQVQAVAKRLIKPGEMRLAIIGPYKNRQVFEKLLQ